MIIWFEGIFLSDKITFHVCFFFHDAFKVTRQICFSNFSRADIFGGWSKPRTIPTVLTWFFQATWSPPPRTQRSRSVRTPPPTSSVRRWFPKCPTRAPRTNSSTRRSIWTVRSTLAAVSAVAALSTAPSSTLRQRPLLPTTRASLARCRPMARVIHAWSEYCFGSRACPWERSHPAFLAFHFGWQILLPPPLRRRLPATSGADCRLSRDARELGYFWTARQDTVELAYLTWPS